MSRESRKNRKNRKNRKSQENQGHDAAPATPAPAPRPYTTPRAYTPRGFNPDAPAVTRTLPDEELATVRQAFSQDALARVCTLPEEGFGPAYGMSTVMTSDDDGFSSAYRRKYAKNEDFYCFRDNGARVLAVAHLDTVVSPHQRTARFAETPCGPAVVSGALDDRLGAYIILELLPRLGITYDTLLTTGEEYGCSTARSFQPDKDYDWMIEFDRGGTDVVMYQYDDAVIRKAVRASGAVVGEGIFSDIGFLEHLGIKGMNWGVGYRDYHSVRGHAYLNETFSMVELYRRFARQNEGKAMPHASSRYCSSFLSDDDLDFDLDCDTCGTMSAVDGRTLICVTCGTCRECSEEAQFNCQCTSSHLRNLGVRRPGNEEEGVHLFSVTGNGTASYSPATGTESYVPLSAGEAAEQDVTTRASLAQGGWTAWPLPSVPDTEAVDVAGYPSEAEATAVIESVLGEEGWDDPEA